MKEAIHYQSHIWRTAEWIVMGEGKTDRIDTVDTIVQMDGWRDGWMNNFIKCHSIQLLTYMRTLWYMNGWNWMDRWMDEWGWVGGYTNGWMNTHLSPHQRAHMSCCMLSSLVCVHNPGSACNDAHAQQLQQWLKVKQSVQCVQPWDIHPVTVSWEDGLKR